MTPVTRKFGHIKKALLPAVAMAGLLALAGCATQQPYYGGSSDYGTTYGSAPGNTHGKYCGQCGVVQSVRQVYLQGNDTGKTLGAVIGAVAGGLLGNTVGSGDGRKAATVAGAVAGGAVGYQVGKRAGDGGDYAWQIQVRLDDGRTATVTQRQNPNVRRGDYVQISNNRVYKR